MQYLMLLYYKHPDSYNKCVDAVRNEFSSLVKHPSPPPPNNKVMIFDSFAPKKMAIENPILSQCLSCNVVVK